MSALVPIEVAPGGTSRSADGRYVWQYSPTLVWVDECDLLSDFPRWLWCHDEPAPGCRVYWGSHGCCLVRGHAGDCFCECAWEADEEDEGVVVHTWFDQAAYLKDDTNVGGPPYYGPDTTFYGEDVEARGLPTRAYDGRS
jgi:hypothetical protein